MKHILYLFAIIGLYITGCTDKESGVPPITQPVGTGTYQSVSSEIFCTPYFAQSFPNNADLSEIYTSEEAFEHFYRLHPDAERVDYREQSIILVNGPGKKRSVIGQEYYKVADNLHVLAIHTTPSDCDNWYASALVPAIPEGMAVGIMEIKHTDEPQIYTNTGSYNVFSASEYPLPGNVQDNLKVIRSQPEYDAYFSEGNKTATIDFTKYSLIVGSRYYAKPYKCAWRLVHISKDIYVLSGQFHYNLFGTNEIENWSFSVLVPAIPSDAVVGMLTTQYWDDETPVRVPSADPVDRETYLLPETFTIPGNTTDSLFVIRTQADFDRYFSDHADAKPVNFAQRSLLIARGNSPRKVESVNGFYSILYDKGYFFGVNIQTVENTKSESWYHAITVPLLPKDAKVWLLTSYDRIL